MFLTPAPLLTAPPVTQPPQPEQEHHHHHHHAPYHPIIDPFALHPLSFYDYALFGAPLLPFRTNDQTLQRLKKPSGTIRKTSRMKVKKNVHSNSRISKQRMNRLAPRPVRRVSLLKTRKKNKKRLIKKRTYPVRKNQISQKKNHKKIQFSRQFNLPGRNSSPVLVSSSDLVRGVNFAFKGKSYRLTLRQMIKLLRRKNLLKKRKISPKSKRRYHKFGKRVLSKS